MAAFARSVTSVHLLSLPPPGADDLTCFLADNASLTELLSTLSKFQNWSGLSINRKKSKILQPGIEDGESLEGIPVVKCIKILGIWFDTDVSDERAYEKNFKHILDRAKSICGSWSNRNLSLKGKVTVINSLIASLFQYPTAAIYTPVRVLTEYRKILVNFLWNGKKPKIAYKTLILPTDRGGLKLMDLETRIQVNLLQWIKRVINNPNSSAASTLKTIIGTDSLSAFLAAKRGPGMDSTSPHLFYDAALSVWNHLHGFEPTTEGEVRAELIWQNKRILIGGSPLKGTEWQRAGIRYISDLCHRNTGTFLSHTELANTYNVTCSFLDLLQVRMAIPLHWRRLLTDHPPPDTPLLSDYEIKIQGQNLADASALRAKAMYELIIQGRDTVSTACLRWQEDKEEIVLSDREEWRESCTSSFKATRETKLQSFHYKVVNRTLPCGSFLQRVRIAESDWCAFCDETDLITHHLFKCAKVQPFWIQLCEWFRREVNLYLDRLSAKEYIFGLARGAHLRDPINYILLSIKFYIFRQKMFHDCDLDTRH